MSRLYLRTVCLSIAFFAGVYLFAQGATMYSGFEDGRLIYMAMGAAIVVYVVIVLLNSDNTRRE